MIHEFGGRLGMTIALQSMGYTTVDLSANVRAGPTTIPSQSIIRLRATDR
jgi:hypothetical protein